MYFLRKLKERIPRHLWEAMRAARPDLLDGVPTIGRKINWDLIDGAPLPLVGNTLEQQVSWRNEMDPVLSNLAAMHVPLLSPDEARSGDPGHARPVPQVQAARVDPPLPNRMNHDWMEFRGLREFRAMNRRVQPLETMNLGGLFLPRTGTGTDDWATRQLGNSARSELQSTYGETTH